MVNSFDKINGVSNVSSLTNIDLFTDGGEYLLSPVYENITKSSDSLKSTMSPSFTACTTSESR